MVGVAGFEPATPSSRTRCATRLRYTPTAKAGRRFIATASRARKAQAITVSVAHELSGLGSTRVVRFSASGWRRIDEPDDVATGPEDAEVSRRFEPVGAQGAISNGGWRAVGVLGTAVPALPAAL